MRIPEAECPIDTNHVGISYPGKSEEPNDNSGHKKTREIAGPVDYLCLLEITLVYKLIIPFWGAVIPTNDVVPWVFKLFSTNYNIFSLLWSRFRIIHGTLIDYSLN